MPDLLKRFWEIDFLRGLAVLMMIIFHIFFDLAYFGAQAAGFNSGFWLYFGRLTASIFILLIGISLTLSYSRATQAHTKPLPLKYLRRGLKIFSLGLLISMVTWAFLKDGFIMFGVLHFIGLSIILAYPLLKHRRASLLLGLGFIGFGLVLKNLTFSFPWLLWLGLKPASFYTFDYFPIFPWFGLVLIGLFLGNQLYPKYKRSFKIPDLSNSLPAKPFCFLGRHSLIIYLAHQPILIALLHFLGLVSLGGILL